MEGGKIGRQFLTICFIFLTLGILFGARREATTLEGSDRRLIYRKVNKNLSGLYHLRHILRQCAESNLFHVAPRALL